MGYVLAVEWTAKAGQGDRIAEIQKEFAPLAREEPGCRKFFVSRSEDDPDRFFLYEEYDDEAAFDAHLETPHFERLIRGAALDLLQDSQKGIYEPLD